MNAQEKEFQRLLHERAQQRHAELEEQRRKAGAEWLGSKDTPWDEAAFDAETERGVEEFTAWKNEQTAQHRERVRTENARVFVKSTPRYIPTPENANNISAYLKQHELPATVQNLQRAVAELEPILDLHPAPIQAVKNYTEAELYEMPEEKLIEICDQSAAQARILEEGRYDE